MPSSNSGPLWRRTHPSYSASGIIDKASVIDHVASVLTVTCDTSVPVIEDVTSVSVDSYATPAPVTDNAIASSLAVTFFHTQSAVGSCLHHGITGLSQLWGLQRHVSSLGRVGCACVQPSLSGTDRCRASVQQRIVEQEQM